MKKHRPDDFLLSHVVDGYSLAMDFPVTRANRADLWKLCGELSDLVCEAGGRFYPAKDLTVRPQDFQRAWGQERIAKFRAIRKRVDPAGILRTQWATRVGVDEG
jgi:FAD/FMN-containing dehydrogenase